MIKNGFLPSIGNIKILLTALLLFACFASCAKGETEHVYLSASGSDSNDGLSPVNPLQTFEAAVRTALSNDYKLILVSGNFDLAPGEDGSGWLLENVSNLTISGGWDKRFDKQDGVSVLNGKNACAHVVRLTRCSGIVLTNFLVTGGFAPGGSGAGIFIDNSISNFVYCAASNNTSKYGGGVCISNGSQNLFAGTAANNKAEFGGGVCFSMGSYNRAAAVVTNNRAVTCGGGIYVLGSRHIIDCDAASNYSVYGGGVYIRGNGNTVSGNMTGNTAELRGGGIYMELCTNNTITATLSGNTGASIYPGNPQNDYNLSFHMQGGGGACIVNGYGNTFSGIVSGNASGNVAGGIYFLMSDSNTIQATLSSNTAVYGGGMILDGFDNDLSLDVFCNRAYEGAGIYLIGDRNTLSGSIRNNNATDKAGGVELGGNSNELRVAVTGNVAGDSGGGIYLGFTLCNRLSGSVTDNRAQNGGGLYFYYSKQNVISMKIENNTAISNGGGVLIFPTAFNLSLSNIFASNAVIRGNRCDRNGSGGGIYAINFDYRTVVLFEPGVVLTPNYRGSGNGTIDDLCGIDTPQ